MKIEHIGEPELEFGGGGRHVDVRFGLMDFGPLDRGTVHAPSDVKVGVIGTTETVEGVTRWLDLCGNGVGAKISRQPNLFPRFPGFSRSGPFGVDMVLDDQLRGVIPHRSIVRLVSAPATPGLVEDAVSLFI